MNTFKIGKEFEKICFKFLKQIFNEVEWLSEKNKSVFDFRCKDNDKWLYGDAKFSSNSNIVYLLPSQKNADFVIKNNKNGEPIFIIRDNFIGEVGITGCNEESRTSIKISIYNRNELRKIGVMSESYNDVIGRLIKLFNNGTIKNKGKKASYEDKI